MKKLTVRDLFNCKGERQLTEVYCDTPDEAAACEAGGIDMIVSLVDNQPQAFREAAPNTFLTLAIKPHAVVTPAEAVRAGFDALDRGADAVYTAANFTAIEAMADAGIPTVGHVGYIPYRSSWFGGPRAVGKTSTEANALLERAKRYQEAGAIAIELELVPAEVAREISSRVDLIVLSMGSGPHCDGQYLFASDILGKNTGHVPRHARSYRNLAAEYARIHAESVTAFTEFASDVANGGFPDDSESVKVAAEELESFKAQLVETGAPAQHPRVRQLGVPQRLD